MRPVVPEEDEYAAVDLGGGCAALAFICFAASLGTRFLVRLLPHALRHYPRGAFLSAVAVPLFAGTGLLLALVAYRSPKSRGLARTALFLNGVALFFGALAMAAFYWILPH